MATEKPVEEREKALEPSPVPVVIRDRRPRAARLLPRNVQTWIMVGLAGLMLLVILITGQTTPTPVAPAPTAEPQPTPVTPDRVRSYQERLAEQEQRLREQQAREVLPPPSPVAFPPPADLPAPQPVSTAADERRRRDEQSLFADNVAFSRRDGPAPRTGATVPAPWLGAHAGPPERSAAAAGAAPAPTADVSADRASVSGHDAGDGAIGLTGQPGAASDTLLEGTVIETVLTNRLDGTFEGPVQCLVTSPVYSRDRQTVVIPSGARVLGSAAPVRAWGDIRLAVRFHRLILPDGRTVPLETATGLNQFGETGLKDEVNRHYWQVFGASIAIGAIGGLAQVGTQSGLDQSAVEATRQSAGSSLATSTARVLDRYLNILPTVTIREGHRVLVVLTHDLVLPRVTSTARGGRS